MKLHRRSFLGFLGGAAASGPSAVKKASAMGMADLSMMGVNANAAMGVAEIYDPDPDHRANWAKKQLKKLAGMTAKAEAERKRTFYVEGLSPHVAVLRSVSLPMKIRMSREHQYATNEKAERTKYQGLIEGWWFN